MIGLTINLNLVLQTRCAWYALLAIVNNFGRIDKVDNVGIVFVLCKKQGKKVLVETHDDLDKQLKVISRSRERPRNMLKSKKSSSE